MHAHLHTVIQLNQPRRLGDAYMSNSPLMPAYFFHLAFELHLSRSSPKTSYTPPPQADIFTSELPAHSSTNWTTPAPPQREYSRTLKPVASSSDVSHTSKHGERSLSTRERPLNPRERPTNSRRYSHRTRPSFSEHHSSPVPLVKPPARPAHTRTQSFVTKDWRFDTISILSIDMQASDEDDTARPRAKSLKHPAGSSGGLATKGKYIPSEAKDTDVGWGVVHLYRDGQETPGLYGDGDGTEFREEDCTTLCILAVPSYMTPSDLLGFVGEQTREVVSHFRLIRTARANKYMVLMKFREAAKARAWRKEWNGKTFNSMEVRPLFSPGYGLAKLTFRSQSTAMSSSSSLLRSNPTPPTAIPPLTLTLPTIPSRPPPQLHLRHPSHRDRAPPHPQNHSPSPLPSRPNRSHLLHPLSWNSPHVPSASSAWTKQPAS